MLCAGAGTEDGVLLMSVTIWHNPECGTSRNALAMIRATGVEPRVVEYLKAVPDAAAPA